MTKREIIIAVSGFLAALVLVGGGLWWHDNQQNNKKQLSNSGQTTGNHLISLDQSSSGSGGLSVSGGGANDLGQLGSNQSQSQGSQGGNNNSSGGSNGSNGIDPSTFTQYDKYKNDQNALFGDIQPGNGAALGSGNKAAITYKAWLTNGALIDQSAVSASGQPQPFTFTEGGHQVIPGLEEGIFGMKAGGTRLLIIPPAVGYGAQGKGSVPPNAVLIFEVELLSVQ